MRTYTPELLAALQAGKLVSRDFLWIIARDRITGEAVADGNWSDLGNINVDVINPVTGGIVNRQYFGKQGLIQISSIMLVSGISVQTLNIQMSQVSERVQSLVRTYDAKQAQVEIHRGLFSPDTRSLVTPAVCRFFGFVDTVEIKTPREGGDGSVILNCKSHTQEMNRSNSDTRSHESQMARLENDFFYIDTTSVGEQEFFWGKTSGKVSTTNAFTKVFS